MAEYYNVTTNIGDAEIARAIATNTKLNITHIAFGDGNGAVPTPSKTRTTLVKEVHRQAVTKYERHPTVANWIIIETIIPSKIGGFWVREMGVIADGKMISHGSHAPFEKVADPSGVSEYRLKFTQDIRDGNVVAITLDQSLIYATQAWVEENYIKRSEIVDNLISNVSDKPLSAKQGKLLKDTKLNRTSTSNQKFDLSQRHFDGIHTEYTWLNAPTNTIAATLFFNYSPDWIGKLFYNISGNRIYAQSLQRGTENTEWMPIAYLTDNVASASKLKDSRKINNVNFDGTSDITIYDSSKLPLTGGTITGNLTVSEYIVFDKASSSSSDPLPFLGGGGGKARGINIGSLLISNSYNDAVKVPANGAYIKGQLVIDGGVSGNSSTATKLATARTIGGVSFDGSANINLPGVNTAGNQNTSGNAATATTSSACTGNSATATKFATARTIGGVSFDGSANINLPGVNTVGNQNTTGTAKIAYLGGINNETSLNAARDSGFYQVNGYSIDGTYNYGILSVFTNGGVTVQIYYPHIISNSVVMITRQTFDNGISWRGWNYLYQNDSSKLPLSGGTVSGNLTVLGNISFDKVVGSSSEPVSFLTGGTARGVRTGSLLISNSYSEDAKVPLNGAYIKGSINTDSSMYIGLRNGAKDSVFNDRINILPPSHSGVWNIGIFDDAANSNFCIKYGNNSPLTFDHIGNFTILGNVKAPTFIGSLNGNAATATKLATARTIGGVSFDGSANISLPGVNIAGNQNTSGNAATATTASSCTGNSATATKLTTARTIGGVLFDGTANINLPGVNTAGNQNTSGNAATATKLATARNIALSGAVSGSATFDGSGNISIPTSLNHGLGIAQTWGDYTSSRSSGTTYTNSSPQPIQICIYLEGSGNGAAVNVIVGGIILFALTNTTAWGTSRGCAVVVPPNTTYRVDGLFTKWTELR